MKYELYYIYISKNKKTNSLSGVEPDCGLLLQVALHALQRVCFFGAVAVFSDFFCVLCFINFYVF